MAIYIEDKCAEAGYKAYADSTHGLNFRGEKMPTWQKLPEQQKAAWIAATSAITAYFHHFLNQAEIGE
jgi:hypothetical protein